MSFVKRIFSRPQLGHNVLSNRASSLGRPLLPYVETVGSSVCSSVGNQLLPNMKKWAAEWAANGKFCQYK